MSYDTFHKIRQLENGDFIVTTKCSNDDCPPHEWTMDYYRTAFPYLNNEQRKAAFILNGLFNGNRYYPTQYKRLERLAWEYCKTVYSKTGKYPYDSVVCGVPMSQEQYEREAEQIKADPSGYIPFVFRENPSRTYEDYAAETNAALLDAVNGFTAYVRERGHEPTITAKVKLNSGDYVAKLTMNSRRMAVTSDEKQAQIFKRTQTEIEALIRRIPAQFAPQIITA